MNTRTTAWFALILLAGCGEANSRDTSAFAPDPAGFKFLDSASAAASNASLSQETVAFAADLYSALGEGSDNLVFSPHAVSLALGTVTLGASGETAQQLRRVLHWDIATADVSARLYTWREALVQSAAASPNTVLHVANAVWGVPQLNPTAAYRNALALAFGTQWFTLDMRSPDAARQQINAWVAQATQGGIQNLLASGQLDPSSQLLATSALYMAAPWHKPFSKAAVRSKAFYKANGQVVQVATMSQQMGAGYGETDAFQVVDLPYEGNNLHFTVLLPTQGMLPATVSAESLTDAVASLQPRRVKLTLPKFKVSGTYSLRGALQALGVRDAFAAGLADFTAITGGSEIVLNNIVHQTLVDVDEAGTHAAAATAVTMNPTAVMGGTATVDVDRPFLFMVRDANSGSLLFLGRVAHP